MSIFHKTHTDSSFSECNSGGLLLLFFLAALSAHLLLGILFKVRETPQRQESANERFTAFVPEEDLSGYPGLEYSLFYRNPEIFLRGGDYYGFGYFRLLAEYPGLSATGLQRNGDAAAPALFGPAFVPHFSDWRPHETSADFASYQPLSAALFSPSETLHPASAAEYPCWRDIRGVILTDIPKPPALDLMKLLDREAPLSASRYELIFPEKNEFSPEIRLLASCGNRALDRLGESLLSRWALTRRTPDSSMPLVMPLRRMDFEVAWRPPQKNLPHSGDALAEGFPDQQTMSRPATSGERGAGNGEKNQ